MNEQQYLRQLERLLSRFEQNDIKDILADYREHFLAGRQKGLSEQEVAARLGLPRQIAGEYLALSLLNGKNIAIHQVTGSKRSSTTRFLTRILSLGFVWICLLFPLILALVIVAFSLMIAGWAIVIYGLCCYFIIAMPNLQFITSFSPVVTHLLLIGSMLIGLGMGYHFIKGLRGSTKVFIAVTKFVFGRKKGVQNYEQSI